MPRSQRPMFAPRLTPRWTARLEVLLIFAVFFVHGAWPVPDVNEPHYLGKAIHFWNPAWAPDDDFLRSADAHQVFYVVFGWLSLWLEPSVLAWTGRLVTWFLLAWAWHRLSRSLVDRPWWSVLAAALFVCLLQYGNLAGEWVVGGVEAKGFAYVLVWLGLQSMLRAQWNRVWLLLGAATAFHVLVGGWSLLAAGVVCWAQGQDRPSLRRMIPAWLGAGLLALPGLVPSLWLTWGVDPATVQRANVIYVYYRLGHHLVPAYFTPVHYVTFGLLVLYWWVLDRLAPRDAPSRRLRWFVGTALGVAGVGLVLGVVAGFAPVWAAGVLRYYWFRLADVAVPLGAALLAVRCLAERAWPKPWLQRWVWAATVGVALLHLGMTAPLRVVPVVPRADQTRPAGPALVRHYVAWRRACAWVAESGQIPPDARFLTPRMSSTFKWYTGRSEVATWKDVPQDAPSLVVWWDKLLDIYTIDDPQTGRRWCRSLAELGTQRLIELGRKYRAGYVLTVRRPALELEVVYQSRGEPYVIYKLPIEPNP